MEICGHGYLREFISQQSKAQKLSAGVNRQNDPFVSIYLPSQLMFTTT